MWARLDDGFADHPKIEALGDKAFRVHVRGICYAAKHLTDGLIPMTVAERLGGKRERNELVRGGVWHADPAGYRLHDYLEYNPPRDEVLAERERKREARSRGGKAGEKSAKKARGVTGQSGEKDPVFERTVPDDSEHEPSPDVPEPRPVPSSSSPSEPGSGRPDVDQLAALVGGPSEEAADVRTPMLVDLGFLETVFNDTQRHLFAKIVLENPEFRDVPPGVVERLKRKYSSATVTEALRRLISSLPDRAASPAAYLERLVGAAADEGMSA